MHIFATLAYFLSLFLLFSGSVSVSAHNTRLKQFHPARSTTDTCASVSGELIVKGNDVATIAACLCTSTAWKYISEVSLLRKASEQYGESAVKKALKKMITESSTKSHCHYPKHAGAVAPSDGSCTTSCSWECKNGFSPSFASSDPESSSPSKTTQPTGCHCPAPKVVYNGKCVEGMVASPSGSARPSHAPSPIPSGSLHARESWSWW